MIKGEEQNRGHWKIDNANHPYICRDNIIRAAQLHIGKKLIVRPVQLLSPLELHCEDVTTANRNKKINELNTSST